MQNKLSGLQKGVGPVCVVLMALLVGAADAQQTPSELPSYDVELVIFRTITANATPEQWILEEREAGLPLEIPDDEPTPFTATVEPVPAAATFPALPSSRFKLTAIEQSLRRSRNYQPLAHIGWTQPGFDRNAAQYLPVDALAPNSGLTGQIAVTRGRYLHLTLELTYDSPATADEPSQRYVMRQTRRMRSNERHYIDHPRIGVIALVTPTEQ